MAELQNANPTILVLPTSTVGDVYMPVDFFILILVLAQSERQDLIDEVFDEDDLDKFDAFEVFQTIRHLNDPEHPLTLEQLKVITVILGVDHLK
jgi:hypothetical protein